MRQTWLAAMTKSLKKVVGLGLTCVKKEVNE